jgi:hypothetical protein
VQHALLRNLRLWHDVVQRAQPPAAGVRIEEEGVVAQVVEDE